MNSETSQFQVLHSSAGAGKTHALVTEYLLRSLSYPGSNGFRKVLALTFTNKAAAEMTERVVNYLGILSSLDSTPQIGGDIRSVVDRLCSTLSIGEPTLQAKSQLLLKHLIHDRSSMAISTLDAFTKKITQPFARDLQIAFDQDMTTETDYYGTLAVESLLDRSNPEELSSSILIAACERKIEDEKSWDVKQPLNSIIKLLQEEESAQRLEFYRGLAPEQLLDMDKELKRGIDAYYRQLNKHGLEGLKLIDDAAIPYSEFPSNGALPAFLKKLSQLKGGKLPAHTSALGSLRSGNLFAKTYKGDFQGQADSLFTHLEPVLLRTQELFEQCSKQLIIPQSIRNELMMVGALAFLDEQLDEVKTEHGVLYFSDLTRKVAGIIQEEPTPFVYERIGERYDHILIDEFQDTSILQWQNLIPLVENALSNGGSAFLVGDAKQAIYRWRNGEVRQFIELPEIHSKHLLALGNQREQTLKNYFKELPPLADNYRSDRAVIEFNNAFFDAAKVHLSDELQSVYHAHKQCVKVQRDGYVHLQLLDKTDPLKIDDMRQESMGLVSGMIDECVELGYSPSDIVLLVRTSTLGALAAKYLMEHGYKVSSPNSFKLGNDQKVDLVVELLRYLHRPNDPSAARIHARMKTMELRTDLLEHLDGPIPSVRQLADTLVKGMAITPEDSGLYELINSLTYELELDPSSDLMLLTLLELAHDHGRYGDSGIGSFLEHYDRTYKEQGVQLAVDKDAVRIMTIHQSKGLGLPVLILPFAEMASGGSKGDPLWISAQEFGLPHALVQHSKALVDSGVEEALEESAMTELDNLNLLYVACTRAKNRLYILAQRAKRLSPKSMATKQFVQFIEDHGTNGIYEFGDKYERAAREKPIDKQSLKIGNSKREGHSQLVFRKEAPQGWMVEDPDPLRTQGERIHALFERINTLDDLDNALAWAEAGHGISDELKNSIRTLLHREDVASFYKIGLNGINEPTILLENGAAQRPDRLVFDESGNVRILDIKTGEPSSAHERQIQGYVKAIQQLGYTQVHGYLLYIKSKELKAVE